VRRERLDSFLQGAAPQAREQFDHVVREVSRETKEEPGLSRINALRRHLGNCPDWLKPAIEDLIDEETAGPIEGQEAPDFCLKKPGGEERVRLSRFRSERPAALIFGSYT
jgi:hypothetical protein